MADPFTADGNVLLASYEHVRRAIEFNHTPFAGWSEFTGGGIQREGQNYVFGAGDEPRGITDGHAVPQDLTGKVEILTWQLLKQSLQAFAIAQGDASGTNYQKVEWQIVDQYRAQDPTKPTLTITYTVKIGAEKPQTPNDGTQFYQELTLKQVGIAQETFGT